MPFHPDIRDGRLSSSPKVPAREAATLLFHLFQQNLRSLLSRNRPFWEGLYRTAAASQ